MSSTRDATNDSSNDGSSTEYEFSHTVDEFTVWESDTFSVVQNEQSNEMALFDQKWSIDGIDDAQLLMHFNYVNDENVSDRVEEMFARADGCSTMEVRPDMSVRPQDDSTDDGSTDNESEPKDDRNEYERVDFSGVINTDVLDPILRHTTELFAEFTVVINRYGWHIRVVEPTNVAMMDCRIHTDDWEHFDSVRDGPFGVSHKSLREMTDFVEATDGDAHVSIEDGTLTMSDGDRLFTDTPLINPDSQRQRPDIPELSEEASVTVPSDTNDMWDLTKWVRQNKSGGNTHVSVGGNGIGFDLGTNYKGIQENDPIMLTDVETEGEADSFYSMDMLYKWFKKPLKTQLTSEDYTFSFHGREENNSDGCVLHVTKEYEGDSKLSFMVAPRVNRN